MACLIPGSKPANIRIFDKILLGGASKTQQQVGFISGETCQITAWPLSELAMTAGTVLVPTGNICRFFNQGTNNPFQARLVTCRFSHCKAGWLIELKTTLNFQAGTSRKQSSLNTHHERIWDPCSSRLDNCVAFVQCSKRNTVQVKNHLYLSAT